MTDSDFNNTIKTFLKDFNEMCRADRKDFLIREKLVTYEHSTRTQRYEVTYRVRSKSNIWFIEAVTDGFWIFKKRFPLIRITRNKDMVDITGVHTGSIRNFKQEE
ncbi:MAG: hypothetical protein AAGI07_10570, partial [Bacteroidota bacterium]